MNIKNLEAAMHAFVESKGWYREDTTHPQTPKNLAISLAIETAEVLEHFQWSSEVADKEALAGELADVLLYLLQLAGLQGIDLEQAVINKLAINYGRTWNNNIP